MSRITYKMVKEWIKESAFGQLYGFSINGWNDYYHLMRNNHELVCSAKTPGEIWEKFNLIKTGYYMAKEEK